VVLEHVRQPGLGIFFMMTLISNKIAHDSLSYPLDTKLFEGCTFLSERSGVTDMNSIFLY